MPELRRNGDFWVALEQLKRSSIKDPRGDEDAIGLSEQLERLLSLAGIRPGGLRNDTIAGAAANPVPAMRAATAATRLAITLAERDAQREQRLNLLRADLLLGVTGVQPTLAEEDLTRCMADCRDLVYCLAGALSDVASTSAGNERREAMERYKRVCDIVFR